MDKMFSLNNPSNFQFETILKQFFEVGDILEVNPYGSGHINDTYKAVLQKNGSIETILLQRLNHQVFNRPAEVMHNINKVAEHLTGQSYSMEILTPFPCKTGAFLYHDELGNYWRTFPFIDKTIAYEKVDTPEQAYNGAWAFGHFIKGLHSLDTNDLKVTIPKFHDGKHRLNEFKDAIEVAKAQRIKDAKSELDLTLKHLEIFTRVSLHHLPKRVLHHDTKIGNVLFSEKTGKPACVIDLDTIMPGIVLSDFGDMARTFTTNSLEDEVDLSNVVMRMPVYQAMQEGFLSACGNVLTSNEKENLSIAGPWMTLMQALRFLTDYLRGDVYYKIKYPEHNLVRTRNQLTLFKSMLSQL